MSGLDTSQDITDEQSLHEAEEQGEDLSKVQGKGAADAPEAKLPTDESPAQS